MLRDRQLDTLAECTLEWHPRQSTLPYFTQSVSWHIPLAEQCTVPNYESKLHCRYAHNLWLTVHKHPFKNKQFVVAALVRRCDILLHRQTHCLTVKTNVKPNCRPSWLFLCIGNSVVDFHIEVKQGFCFLFTVCPDERHCVCSSGLLELFCC